MFDNLPALSADCTLEVRDELDAYLADPDVVGGGTTKEIVAWWYERRGVYPRLHRMALDYFTIPGMC